MNIREYQNRDEQNVIDLWFKCNLVVPWNNPKADIRRKLKTDPDLFLVGVLEGKVVATVMGGYEGHRGWINCLAVDPDYQRKGLGRHLMGDVERRIKERGCPKINLEVREGNKGVIDFYLSLGYTDNKIIGLGKRLEGDEPYQGRDR